MFVKVVSLRIRIANRAISQLMRVMNSEIFMKEHTGIIEIMNSPLSWWEMEDDKLRIWIDCENLDYLQVVKQFNE